MTNPNSNLSIVPGITKYNSIYSIKSSVGVEKVITIKVVY